ncbi:hypothetical protein [Halorubrum tebenquichense]|uniref:hypothetical protein n=1 Tax=Halorubrum tebenquichense TaxID=119434 RepID=UPI000AC46867|nr:hypothetical protein [Halorubrum tebenquichense]
MNNNRLLDLSDLIGLPPNDSNEENSQRISYNFTLVDLGEGHTKTLLERISQCTEYIQTFTINLHYENDSPPTQILRLRGSDLEVPSGDSIKESQEDSDWFSKFRKASSFYISDAQFDDLSAELFSIEHPEKRELDVSLQINKSTIEDHISDQLGTDPTKQNICAWSNRKHLREWIRDTRVDEVVNSLFTPRKSPVFVFLSGQNGIQTSSGYIQTVDIDQITEISTSDWEVNRDQYIGLFKEVEDIFVRNPPLPSKLFTSSELRNLFQPVFLYGVFSGISDQTTVKPHKLSFTISSEKKEIEDSLSLSESMDSETLSDLYDFYTVFLERGTREPYRSLWHRAIVEHCSSPRSIPDQVDEIEHYYQSLEQNAIEGNFTELSGAVQDAQVFIGDVTNNLSNATTSTTNEIQKIVIALFTAVAGNVFLLLRRASIAESAIFTTVFSAGLLLLYFPTAQEKVDELSNIISEGESDADLYSDLIRSVGADELVDLDRFSSRQQAYIGLAQDRVDWAEKRLSQAFLLITLTWTLSTWYVLLTNPLLSTYSIVVIGTAVASIWVGAKQINRKYQTTIDITGHQLGVGLIPLIVVLITVLGKLIF